MNDCTNIRDVANLKWKKESKSHIPESNADAGKEKGQFASVTEIRQLRVEFHEMSERIYLNIADFTHAIERSQKEQTEWLIRTMMAIQGLAFLIIRFL